MGMMESWLKFLDTRKVAIGALLFCAAVTVFWQPVIDGLREGNHGRQTSHAMALARNLSFDHNLLMYGRAYLNPDGTISRTEYSRFPMGAIAAVKLAILPYPNDFRNQLALAYRVMLVFFLAGMVMVFFTAMRLTDKAILVAGAMAFASASYYTTYFCDMVFFEVPSFFGFLLVLHGVVIYHQENRYRQLVLKMLGALLFGWHAYAVLFTYLGLKWADAYYRTRSLHGIVSRREVRLAAGAVAFGAAILTWNIAIEWSSAGKPFTELRSVESAMFRLGIKESPDVLVMDESLKARGEWPQYLTYQMYRIGRAAIPWSFQRAQVHRPTTAILGALILTGVLIVAARSRERVLVLTIVLSSITWHILMRKFSAFHQFETLFHIGIVVVAYYALLSFLYRNLPVTGVVVCLAGVGVFTASYIHAATLKADQTPPAVPKIEPGIAADVYMTMEYQGFLDSIGVNNRIAIVGDPWLTGGTMVGVEYYLAGNFVAHDFDTTRDVYVVSLKPYLTDSLGLELLTPKNRRVYFYRNPAYRPE